MWKNTKDGWKEIGWFFVDTLEPMNWGLSVEPRKNPKKLVAIDGDKEREIKLLYVDTKKEYKDH